MSTAALEGLLWFVLVLSATVVLQRVLQREIQAIFLIITRRPQVAIVLFSILFFPGVFLHEGSHYLIARLLGVRTGRFSLIPRPLPNGRLQLGFVETAPTDVLRDALIGLAPLVTGGLFIAYAGLAKLRLSDLWEGLQLSGIDGLITAGKGLYNQPDFWLWFYLVFTVSSTMLPSSTDRRSWLPVVLIFALLLGLNLLLGAGPWLVEHFAGPFLQAIQAITIVFGVSVAVHLILLPPVWGLRRLLSWVLGLEIG